MPTTIDQLKSMGFDDTITKAPKRAIITVAGHQKRGKTNFALTAPEPIFLFDYDKGVEGVKEKFQNQGKKIYHDKYRASKSSNQDDSKTMWGLFENKVKAVYDYNKGTAVFDSVTGFYELSRLAEFGKLAEVRPHHYGRVNAKWERILSMAYESEMNTIFICRLKPKYVNEVRTSEYDVAGPPAILYDVQANIICDREGTGKDLTWYLDLYDCRHNPKVMGTILSGPSNSPMVGFPMVLDLIHSK